MGFTDFINSLFGSLRDFASSSTDFKCAQCLKCRQCIKTLSGEKQVRVFTCGAVDQNIAALNNDTYIDSLLPSIQNGFTQEYLDAYNKNRDAIYNYLYSNPVLYQNDTTPILFDTCIPVLTYEELLYFYKAIECPNFRPFIDTSNILGYNDLLITQHVPDLMSFENLSSKDKNLLTQRYDW